MRRRVARSFFILLCGAFATALGVAAALLFTAPGLGLLARLLGDYSNRVLRGSVHIGAVRGDWLRGFSLDSLVIRDTAGVILLEAPRVAVRYRLANLLARRIVIEEARLIRPELTLLKHRGGRMNYEEVLRLGEGRPGGTPPLIEIRDLNISGGRITIRLPWNPDGRLRQAREVDSALAYLRTRPGRRIEPGPDGLEQIRTISNLDAELDLLRISTPDRQPIVLGIANLAAKISDPALDVRALAGRVQTRGDSLRFELDRFALPGTTGSGAGRLDWPRDTLLYRFSLDAPTLALADLRFISPEFPDFRGSARVRAVSRSTTRTEYDIRDLAVGDTASRVAGRLIAISDVHRGLGFRDLDLRLTRLDLEAVRPYLDTLPLRGRISGPLVAEGFFDRMTATLDWSFEDAAVPGATSRLALDGGLRLGGPAGLEFHDAELTRADLDLRTVRTVAPSVQLLGRLGLDGSLSGPFANVVFRGMGQHRDSALPASRFTGMVRLDTRAEVLGITTDVELDSLRFDGIRRSFPSLPTAGAVGGRVKLEGTFEDLVLDLTVGGQLGRVDATGRLRMLPPRWSADSLRVYFQALDLATLTGKGPVTALEGRLEASGTVDSAQAPVGTLVVTLEESRLPELVLDSARAGLRVADSLLTLDTLVAHWQGGRLDGAGTLGWAAPHRGRMLLRAAVTDLAAFDAPLLRLTGWERDSARGDLPLRGTGRADLVLEGALGALSANGVATVDSARWLAYRVQSVRGGLLWSQPDDRFEARIAADSLQRRRLHFSGIVGTAMGRTDSLDWTLGLDGRDAARLRAGGRFAALEDGAGRRLSADSLDLVLLGRRWGLETPLRARLTDSLLALDSVRFVTRDGSGVVSLAGALPRRGAGELRVTALGVELKDLYGLAQRDTAGIAGAVALDARLAGTARAPELRGTAALTGGVFGDFQAPLVRTAFDYREQLLRGNLTFWRTGKPVVEADIRLPLDLALTSVERRQLPGPLSIVARGDSIDLAIAEAFTPNLRRVRGLLSVDARVEGTWETPALAGRIAVRDGAASVPGLGVRYERITGALRLAQDSILAEQLRLESGGGLLELGGGIRLQQLTTPVLNLAMSGRNFLLIDVENYLSLRSSGDVRLTGTLTHPVLTGRGRLANSVIYFADLVQKEIVNLQDPLFADLVDTLALRKYALGADFESRFLDSLAVRDLQFEIGEGVWLRSSEANFQLEGRLLVNKTRHLYRIDGTLDVPRGTYTLKAGGLINRTFTVQRGTVRYFGDLNAELDVEAQHIVRTPTSAQDIPVIVHITGTLFEPELALSTSSDRAPLSEPQLISLLALGTTDPGSAARFGTRDQSAYAAAAIASNALSSELQRALITDLGLDIIEIRPGIATSGFIGGGTAAPTQLAVGRALSRKVFVTANAGFCVVSEQPFSARNLGATLEYRFRRDLRAQISAEPIQTCLLRGVDIFGATRRYQFGAELRWDREF